MSEPRSAACEELELLACGLAAERAIAVRESAEALDDVPMGDSIIRAAPERSSERRGRGQGSECRESPDRPRLDRAVLGVLERHAEEDPLGGGERRIEPLVEAVRAERERLRVAREGFGPAAIQVPRQLVEQQDETEAAAWRRSQRVESSFRRIADKRAEAALELDGQYSAGWKMLGQAKAAAGDRAGAAASYERGIEIADARGDLQAAKEMRVFLKRLRKEEAAGRPHE